MMNRKNLPIKIVLPRSKDIFKNLPGGEPKFFCEYTEDLKKEVILKIEELDLFYKEVFLENSKIPVMGKIIMKEEASAKSHKPVAICQKCKVIGGEELNEIYISFTKKSLGETINFLQKRESKKLKANITAIKDIKPILKEDRLSKNIKEAEKIENSIKVKLFDLDDEYENKILENYLLEKLTNLGITEIKNVNKSKNLKYLKIGIENKEQIEKIAELNGVRYIDFFQKYSSLETHNSTISKEEYSILEGEEEDIIIGVIDSGISQEVKELEKYVIDRVEYVPKNYQNRSHGTFVASMIQYGNELNQIHGDKKRFKFLDVVAVPNSDENFGDVDSISEDDLMDIIEEVIEKYHKNIKIWNMSLGLNTMRKLNKMSDLAIFLDDIQEKYGVQIFVSSGNAEIRREWPVCNDYEDDLTSPAESVRSITVGSLALRESEKSLVKKGQPSPFSRKGPGTNYIIKPELVDYGGNYDYNYCINGLGVKGFDLYGNVIENVGTSFSNPRIVKKFASVFSKIENKDLLLAKGLLIHSANLNSKQKYDSKYYGFGIPSENSDEIIKCSDNEVCLVFRQKIRRGTHLEMYDFPFPKSLIENNKYHGEIAMTLITNPILNSKFEKEYCQTNIDVSFGTYTQKNNGEIKFIGQVPLEKKWDDKYEKNQVENGFKWSPIKTYYRNIKTGINEADGWKLRIDFTPRQDLDIVEYEFLLILTIKATIGKDIYTDVINGLRNNSFITEDLRVANEIRERV